MSLGVYALEPATNGKVLLKTSVGDIDIELWPREAPKACRNFVQLCLEGYYDNTIFHRIVKDFIVQGGDPTGTGLGGDSIYGTPFQDEFHSRLRYRHRGMVGMANTGKNKNRSQFFITLAATPELDNKNTLFGKVTGNTIFNVLKLGESEIGEEERPLFPPRILSAEVLSNPFDDIVPRDLYALGIKKKSAEEAQAKAGTDRPAIRKKRNKALLSFGEEEGAEEQEEQVSFKPRMKSSHAASGPTTSESKQREEKTEDQEDSRSSNSSASDSKSESKQRSSFDDEGDRSRERKRRRTEDSGSDQDEDESVIRSKLKRKETKKKSINHDEEEKEGEKPTTSSAYDEVMGRREREKEERRKEFQQLKKSLLSFKKQAAGTADDENSAKDPKKNVVDPLQEQRLKYKERSKKRADERQKQTMEALKKFQESLKQPDKEWKQHTLKFEKIGGQMKEEEEIYSVFDPLLGKDQSNKPSWHKQRLQPRKEDPDRW